MSPHRLIGALTLALLATACGDNTISNLPELPPDVVILQPLDGSVVLEGAPLTLRAAVHDLETDPENLQLTWGSDVDGAMPGAAVNDEGDVTLDLPAGLSAGEHRIELTAVDHHGQVGSDSVTITAEPNTPPTVGFVYPSDGASVGAGMPITLVAVIVDEHTPTDELVLIWESDIDGQLPGEATLAGSAATLDLPDGLSLGTHQVTARAIDPGGAQGSHSIGIDAGGENQPPTVEFVLPTADWSYPSNSTVVIQATVSDDEDSAEQLVLQWSGLFSESWIEEIPPTNPTSDGQVSFSVLLDCTYYGGDEFQYQAAVTVVDTAGLSAQDWVTFWSDCMHLD